MILNATVLLHSSEYAEKVGLLAAVPYFEYYSVLSLARAVVCMMPTQSWNDGQMIEMSHSASLHLAFEWLQRFDKSKAQELEEIARQLKAQREIASYRAPASGVAKLGGDYDLVALLVTLAEAAQCNSEILAAAVSKYASPATFVVRESDASAISTVSIHDFSFRDPEDESRLSYVMRKTRRPWDLASFMSEGQVEEFIWSWENTERTEDDFTSGGPADWQSIFDVP